MSDCFLLAEKKSDYDMKFYQEGYQVIDGSTQDSQLI